MTVGRPTPRSPSATGEIYGWRGPRLAQTRTSIKGAEGQRRRPALSVETGTPEPPQNWERLPRAFFFFWPTPSGFLPFLPFLINPTSRNDGGRMRRRASDALDCVQSISLTGSADSHPPAGFAPRLPPVTICHRTGWARLKYGSGDSRSVLDAYPMKRSGKHLYEATKAFVLINRFFQSIILWPYIHTNTN